MKSVAAHEVLEALFDVVVDEAKRNDRFARRLMSVFPESLVARIEKPKARRQSFSASDYHAINLLRDHGEAMLRGRLSSLRTKSELRQVATRSGLRLTGKAAKRSASIADIVDGIVAAAKHYEAQRAVAVR